MKDLRGQARVTAFLRNSLAEGAQDVLKLEAMARGEALLGERQRITDAKAFKRAKYSLRIIRCSRHRLDAQPSDTPHASGVLALKCGQALKVSTSSQESCKSPSHELVQRRRTFRFSRVSPWQSERGLDPRRAGIDRAEGTCRLHLRGSCPLGRSESGRALPAFSRPRRTVDRRGTARLRSIRGYAGERLGRRLSGCLLSVRPSRQSLPPIRKERAGLLFRHVRGRHPARSEPRITGSGAACLYRVADRHRAARRHNAGAAASPGPDDDTAHLGVVAWHRVTVRAR